MGPIARIVVVMFAVCAASAGVARGQAPLWILYVGNSYTFTYNIPQQVSALAVDAGFAAPFYGDLSQPSWFLSTHRNDSVTLSVIDQYTFDVVVLQEQSQRPTNPYNPAQFKADAAWLYDRIKAKSPNAKIVLYETWARAAGDALYPSTYATPAEMQSQLRFHYNDAAFNYIPTHVAAARKNDVEVARVGDAWELELDSFAIPLHDADRSHPNFEGSYLAALMLFSTIYDVRRTAGLDPLGRDPATAAALQSVADAVVPEPSGLAVAAVAILAARRTRRGKKKDKGSRRRLQRTGRERYFEPRAGCATADRLQLSSPWP